MDERPVFAVLGAGNAGLGTTADLTLRGFEVRLLEHPRVPESIDQVLAAGGINVHGVAAEGLAKPALVTTDADEALKGADIVLVVVPAFAQRAFAEHIAGALEDGQFVVLSPGGVGGTLAFHRVLMAVRPDLDIVLSETSTLVYAVKKDGPASVWIRGLKDGVTIGSYPARRNAEVVGKLSQAYPQFVGTPNALEAGLNNIANMIHPPAMVLNAGRIEVAAEPWPFYYAGITPGVARVMQALDDERMALLSALGLQGRSLADWLVAFYGGQGMRGDNLYTLWHDSPIHKAALAPQTLDARQLSEDIPYGLVPMSLLADAAGVAAPVARGLIQMASTLNEVDYMAAGRTLTDLGVDGLDPGEIVARAAGEHERVGV